MTHLCQAVGGGARQAPARRVGQLGPINFSAYPSVLIARWTLQGQILYSRL